MATPPTKYQAPALEKGLQILEQLSLKGVPLSHGELAAGMEKSPNEIYRMLLCLEEMGYIIKEAHSGKYKLTLKLYQLSHRHSPVDELKHAADIPMQELAATIKQSCHLSMLYQGQLLVVSQARSPLPIALSVEEGSLFPLVQTASGKLLLAYTEAADRERILKADQAFIELSAPKQTAFESELEAIREQEQLIIPSALSSGITDISVPVGGIDGGILCALTVTVLTNQVDGRAGIDAITQGARECARRIMGNLGWR